MEYLSKFDYSERIAEKRKTGKADDAIDFALQARERYPEENIFEKLLGDIYFQEKRYEPAGAAYIDFLKKIGNKTQYVKHFAHFMQRYSEISEREVIEAYCHRVQESIDSGGVNMWYRVCVKYYPDILNFLRQSFFKMIIALNQQLDI